MKMTVINAETGEQYEVETGEPEPAPEPLTAADYTAAIDAHVEGTARGKGYNGAAHMAGYVSSSVPIWAAEAAAFVAWRDAVWLAAFEVLEKVKAGVISPPSIDDLVSGLPAPNWPEG